MLTKRKVIMVPPRNIKFLSDDCGVSISSVYAALNFTSYSDISDKVRRLALEKYNGHEVFKYIAK